MSLPHECHLFTWEELEQLIAGQWCKVIDASASNLLSVRNDDFLNEISRDEWAQFVDWEELVRRSGCLGGGTLFWLRFGILHSVLGLLRISQNGDRHGKEHPSLVPDDWFEVRPGFIVGGDGHAP